MNANYVSPHEFSVRDIIHKLNIFNTDKNKQYELLCRFINEDGLPLHCNVKELDLSSYASRKTSISSVSGELKIISLDFDSTPSLFKPPLEGDHRGRARFRLLSFEYQNKIYSLKNGAYTIIYDEEIFVKRDLFFTFIGDRKRNDENLKQGLTINTKAKLTINQSQQKRFDAFKVFCDERQVNKNLSNSEHQTIYESFKPPMTKRDFYNELQKYNSRLFALGLNDFYRDKEVKIVFHKGARKK